MFLFILLSAVVVDVSWYWSSNLKMQRAADAAALAGVTYLPGDVPGAYLTARNEAAKNGYSAAGGYTVTPLQDASNPRRLKVTINGDVGTFFARVAGITSFPAQRVAKADFVLPVPMGSPENYYGVFGKVRTPGGGTTVTTINSGATSWFNPSSVPGGNWTTAANAYAPQLTGTVNSATKNSTTNPYQLWGGFNVALPSGGTLAIDGIEVAIRANSAGPSCNVRAALNWTGTSSVTNGNMTSVTQSVNPNTTYQYLTFGSPTDTWGRSWSATEPEQRQSPCPAPVRQPGRQLHDGRCHARGSLAGARLLDPDDVDLRPGCQSDRPKRAGAQPARVLGDDADPGRGRRQWRRLSAAERPGQRQAERGILARQVLRLRGRYAGGRERLRVHLRPGLLRHEYRRPVRDRRPLLRGSVTPVSSFFELWDTKNTPFNLSDDTRVDTTADDTLFRRIQASDPDLNGPSVGGSTQDCSVGATNNQGDGRYWHNRWWPLATGLPGGTTYRVRTSTTDPNSPNDQAGSNGENSYAIWASAGKVHGIGAMQAFSPLPGGSTSEFYLAQIDAVHAGKTVQISLWDPGDTGSLTGQLRIRIPGTGGYVNANLSWSSAKGTTNSGASNCNGLSGTGTSIDTHSGGQRFNGCWVTIDIPIPATYSAPTPPGESQPGWWKIQYVMSGNASDTSFDVTTWQVAIRGNPVHLVLP